MDTSPITIQCQIKCDVQKAWQVFTEPGHITHWNFASDDWHCPSAQNDVRPGGSLKATMASKDGQYSFDFEAIYQTVDLYKKLEYTLADGRKVVVDFSEENGITTVVEQFEPETTHSRELQQSGWQSILNNFARYSEDIMY